MIDTVKIYTEIDETTYNTIKNYSIIKTSIDRGSGELLYEVINSHLEGSYSSSLSVKPQNGGVFGFKNYALSIEGSLHKITKGYNSHDGFYNVQDVVKELIAFTENSYNIKLPSFDNWYLQRIDIAICFDLDKQKYVRDYINNLSSCKYPRRNLKFYQDESIYLSGTSTTLKIYNKLLEFRKHDIKKFLNSNFKLEQYMFNIKGFIRFELEIKKKKLKDFYKIDKNLSIKLVKYEDLKKLWVDEFMKLLKFVKNDLEIVTEREEVFERLKKIYKPVKARNLYNFFVAIKFDGIDTVKKRLSESTYYRNLKELKACNIDISQKYEIQDYNNTIKFNPFEWKEVV